MSSVGYGAASTVRSVELHVVLLHESLRHRLACLSPRVQCPTPGFSIRGILADHARTHDMVATIRAMIGSDATRSGPVLRGLAILAVLVMAFLAGMLVERLRLDARREAMLRRYNQVLQQYREQQMLSEKTIQR